VRVVDPNLKNPRRDSAVSCRLSTLSLPRHGALLQLRNSTLYFDQSRNFDWLDIDAVAFDVIRDLWP
jgi:hypothetical protein